MRKKSCLSLFFGEGKEDDLKDDTWEEKGGGERDGQIRTIEGVKAKKGRGILEEKRFLAHFAKEKKRREGLSDDALWSLQWSKKTTRKKKKRNALQSFFSTRGWLTVHLQIQGKKKKAERLKLMTH